MSEFPHDRSLSSLFPAIELRRAASFSTSMRESPRSQPSRVSVIPTSSSGSPRRLPRRLAAWAAGILLLGAPIVVGLAGWKSAPAESALATPETASAGRSVKIARPDRSRSASVALPATIQPWQTATLHSRVNGYLTRWNVDLGESVKAGQVLAEIDTPELDQELAQAQSQATEAIAAVAQAKAQFQEAEAELNVAQAELTRVRAEATLAQSQLARREKVRNQNVITPEEYDASLRLYQARQAAVAAAAADLTRRQANLTTQAAMIEVSEAVAKGRAANVERLRATQDFQKIVAPFDGVVTRRQAEIGMLVTAGVEPLFVVEDMSRVRVQSHVPQTYASATRPGVVVTVSLPESTEQAEVATVTRTSEAVDSQSRTLLVEIELANESLRYRPGSYALLTLTTNAGDSAWTVPANTLLMRVDGSFVAKVSSDSRAELQPVRLGRDFGGRVAVLEGVQGHEQLIINPTADLANGARVTVEPASPSASENIAQRD